MNVHVTASVGRTTARVETVVISVASAAERRKTTSAMLSGSKLSWSFFDAHTSLMCSEMAYDEDLSRRHFGRRPVAPRDSDLFQPLRRLEGVPG